MSVSKTCKNHEAAITQLKQRFLLDETTTEDRECYSFLLQEWQKSRDIGFDPTHLPNHRDLSVFDRVTMAQREHFSYLSDYYASRHNVLSSLGCAVFYIDNHFAVYAKYGNAEVIEDLKQKGIRIATCFSEEALGINVATLSAHQPLHNVIRIGSENYLDVFRDYACLARYALGSPFGFAGANLIFAPLRIFTGELQIFLEYVLEEEDVSYKDKFLYPLTKERNLLIEKSTTLSKEAFLLIDADGRAVYTSPTFEHMFGRGISEYETPVPVEKFAPQLAFVKQVLKDGNSIIAQSVEVKYITERKHFFVNCLAIEENGVPIGAKAVLRTLKQINEYAVPLRGSSLVYSFENIIGNSSGIMSCKEIAFKASQSTSNVLITGESGTGKELFAQAIHRASDRNDKPFVALNCGAIPKELVGSELFGYEEGAFTGARRGGYVGKIEQAQGGTLFLDEIGEMPLDVQVFLLRFLDSGEITRLGGKKTIPLKVRVISATNRDLYESVQHGSFRLDLYYRLNVLRVSLPPLRERQEDFGILINYFLKDLSPKLGKKVLHASEDVVDVFKRHQWNGNLRELRNVIERCVNLIPDGVEILDVQHLPEGLFIKHETTSPYKTTSEQPFKPYNLTDNSIRTVNYRDLEAKRIQELLLTHRGNKTRVAKAMGFSRATLYNKMKRYGISTQ